MADEMCYQPPEFSILEGKKYSGHFEIGHANAC